MNPASWWGQKVSDWLPKGKGAVPTDGHALAAGSGAATVKAERPAEVLDAAVVRKVLKPLQAVADSTVSEVEGGRRARAFAQWYAAASAQERRRACILMSERFAPDPQRIRQAREAYETAVGTAEEGVAEIRLRKALYSDRTRLLQRFAVFPEGMRFLVDLRAELLPQLKAEKRLLALDAELESLFSTWFDVAFLELRRISWDSPASLVEKLIQYEAVHDIKSWADVKNRLDSDRRCYGFFHARLPDEPLIFVEVAFTREIASNIVPLLDETAEAVDLSKATTAIFYSISNTQTGLKGISFGDSLIKRVVETLKADFPQLKTFATLSPIPGFRTWYRKHAARLLQELPDKHRRTLGAQTDDTAIQLKGEGRASKITGEQGRVAVTSFNHTVLLTGEVKDDKMKADVEQQISTIDGVKTIENDLAVAPVSSLGSRSNDALITGKVKAAIIDTKDLYVSAFKVHTDRGVVYLLGRVTQREGKMAAEVARNAASGIKKVVKLFEYISEEDLKDLATQPAGRGINRPFTSW